MFINNQNLIFASDCKLQIGFFANEWLFSTKLVIYLIWYGHVTTTWLVFPLISYSALHASIFLDVASNDDMVTRISAAVCNALRNSQQQVRVKADS